MKLTTLDTITRKSGWQFKVSQNDFDGGVLIVAFHRIFQTVYVKSFLTTEEGATWVDMLDASTTALLQDSSKSCKP